ncbi:MAG: hypothetical protein ACRD2L_12675 [Terriglobia bacterium]
MNIPHGIAPMVTELCDSFVKAEQIVLDYVQSPQRTVEGYKEAVQRMKASAELLRERAKAYLKRQRSGQQE